MAERTQQVALVTGATSGIGLRTAEIFHLMRHAGDFGLKAENIGFDAQKVIARSRAVSKSKRARSSLTTVWFSRRSRSLASPTFTASRRS